MNNIKRYFYNLLTNKYINRLKNVKNPFREQKLKKDEQFLKVRA